MNQTYKKDDKFLIELYYKALNFKYIRGQQEAEDFAAWLAQKYLENKYQHPSLKYAFVDYLRATYGRTSNVHYLNQKRIKFAGELKEHLIAYPEEDYFNESSIPTIDCISYVNPKYREIYRLVMQEGIKQKEVAEMVGLNSSRISQIITDAKADIKNNIMKEGLINGWTST